jgi:hypothetical protein
MWVRVNDESSGVCLLAQRRAAVRERGFGDKIAPFVHTRGNALDGVATSFVSEYDEVMRWAGSLITVLGTSALVTIAHAEPIGARGAQADLPVGIAAFPVDAASLAQVRAAGAPLRPPARPIAAPVQVTPAPAPAMPAATPTAVPPGCPDSTSAVELGAAALAAMIRDGKGLFAVLGVFGDPDDAKIIDDAAEREVRRMRLMHQLAAMREQESEREFTEALSVYLRKRAFIEGLEAGRQPAPTPLR